MSEDFPEIKIPFWMDGKHTRTLARASRRWWEEVGDWARFPLKQLDPMTCTDRMLDLMAWQRGVTRTVGEADRLYRLRVKHAYANAKDAGQVAGWERIFRRLELGKVAQEERQDGQDWDVIGIGIDDSAFPDVQN
ncbi:MAG: phage tail protein, partial [Bilophila wadsworthia]